MGGLYYPGVPYTRQIIAGSGLTGGGDLSSDVTLEASGGGGGGAIPANIIQAAYSRAIGNQTVTFGSAVVAGSLLLAVITGGGASNAFINNEGWTCFYLGVPTSNQRVTLMYKIADGTETGANVTAPDMTNIALYETDADRLNLSFMAQASSNSSGKLILDFLNAAWGECLSIGAWEHDGNPSIDLDPNVNVFEAHQFTSGNHEAVYFAVSSYIGSVTATPSGGLTDPVAFIIQLGKA